MSNSKSKEDFQVLYSKFIDGLKLQEIYLKSANINYLEKVNFKKTVLIKTKDSTRLELLSENEFEVYQKYTLEAKSKEEEDKTFVRVTCEFAVLYNSKMKPTAKIFKVFKNSTLRLNTWPYFREFVHNSIARMNLPPMIAPLLKA